MNPFLEKPSPVDAGLMDWSTVYARSYDKNEVDPYTKVRIILMNGTEYEAVWFSHQIHRHCPNNDLRRELALARRVEQQQQKRISCLKPIDETPLETTIGYEQLAVDLTAILAQREPDPYVVKVMQFACGGLRPSVPLRGPAGHGGRRPRRAPCGQLYRDHARPPHHIGAPPSL
jgi:hypothetical protein